MAEAVLFSIATAILKSIATEIAKPGGSFASQEIQLLYGAKDELDSLKDTIETIRAVLLDAEKQQWHNNQVKLWLAGLKNVLYDVQDLFDDVATEDLRRKVTPGDKMSKAGGEPGSKILITTRSHVVARVTDVKSAIYDLQGLGTSESWDLFREEAFGDRQASVDQRLEEMGRDIVRKCAGVPLAIRTVGSLLYGKKEDQWNHYRVTELPEIPELDAIDNGIMQVLKFSYDRLPSRLKHCFAYCSLFPKDYVYDKEMMIHLWVAQGFIESLNGEDNLEDVADNYLSELLCRSFLDAESKKWQWRGSIFQDA
ncbi:hypothetical protein NL676_021154 [Syzygium grande]|nr:hypothetical protein NL676_021154 [Syzygium grande]